MEGALVTGAGLRIGRAMALALAADGFFVFVHHNRSGAGARDTVAAAARLGVLDHVQVSDVVVPSLTTPDRAVPGDGHIPLGHIVAAVLATGYGGAFEIEMVGPRIDAEGCGSAILRAMAHMDDVLDGAGHG